MLHTNTINQAIELTKTKPVASTEECLAEMKQIDHEMKVLKARYDQIKNGLIGGYFAHHEEFVGSEGLVLATYKSYAERRFDSAAFKKSHPKMYENFKVEKTVAKFLLK